MALLNLSVFQPLVYRITCTKMVYIYLITCTKMVYTIWLSYVPNIKIKLNCNVQGSPLPFQEGTQFIYSFKKDFSTKLKEYV